MSPCKMLGQYVLYERLKRGWSQTRLSKESGIARQTIAYIEDPELGKSTSFDRAITVLRALNKTLLDFEAFCIANEMFERKNK